MALSDGLRCCTWVVANHGEQYAEDFAHPFNVILWQIDTQRAACELQKFPNIPGGYGAIHSRQTRAFPRIEVLGGNHHRATLAQADLEIFIFGFDDHHYRSAHEELLP